VTLAIKNNQNFMPNKKPISKTKNNFYFDDCPICQAMKEADEQGRSLSEPELRAAFRKAEEKNKGVTFGKEK